MKNGYIRQAWLVLALAIVFGAALAGMEASLSDRIKQNKLAETLSQIPVLVPGSVGGEFDGELLVYRATDADGRLVGWVVPAAGPGFADRIELLIGLDAKARKITGLYVLDQKETPGLGNGVIEDDWRAQFAGKRTDRPVAVTKAEPAETYEIQAITGATISSESVAQIVNTAVADIREKLAAAVEEQQPNG